MELKISQLTRKTVPTRTGDSISVRIKCGDRWYSAWEGDWNASWKAGDVLNIPESRIKTNGDFLNITAPPKGESTGGSSNGGGGAGGADTDKLLEAQRQLYAKMLEIEKKIDKLLNPHDPAAW